MRPDFEKGKIRLFQFTVPGLPQTTLAVALPQVLEVTELTTVVPIPFAPSFVLGLSEWRGDVITVVDIATRLRDDVSKRFAHGSRWRYLVAQVTVNTRFHTVAWPILSGASTFFAPLQAPQTDVPEFFFSAMIYAAVRLNDQPVILLNLEWGCEGYRTDRPVIHEGGNIGNYKTM